MLDGAQVAMSVFETSLSTKGGPVRVSTAPKCQNIYQFSDLHFPVGL